jgi:hypothetical protein
MKPLASVLPPDTLATLPATLEQHLLPVTLSGIGCQNWSLEDGFDSLSAVTERGGTGHPS